MPSIRNLQRVVKCAYDQDNVQFQKSDFTQPSPTTILERHDARNEDGVLSRIVQIVVPGNLFSMFTAALPTVREQMRRTLLLH